MAAARVVRQNSIVCGIITPGVGDGRSIRRQTGAAAEFWLVLAVHSVPSRSARNWRSWSSAFAGDSIDATHPLLPSRWAPSHSHPLALFVRFPARFTAGQRHGELSPQTTAGTSVHARSLSLPAWALGRTADRSNDRRLLAYEPSLTGVGTPVHPGKHVIDPVPLDRFTELCPVLLRPVSGIMAIEWLVGKRRADPQARCLALKRRRYTPRLRC